MYIFSRHRKAKPESMIDAVGAATDIAAKVTSLTGLDVNVWQARFGAPLGTLSWSVRLESQAQLFEATDKMMADPGYVEQALAMYELFEGDATDQLVNVVSGSPAETPPVFVQTTQAVMTNGKYAEAIAFGAEMQQFLADQLGAMTMFGTASYAGFADVGWMLGCDSAAQLDEYEQWQMSNEEYHAKVTSAAGLFVEGSGHQGLIQRIVT